MRMQIQALLRGARGRAAADHVPLRRRGRRVRGRRASSCCDEVARERALGHAVAERRSRSARCSRRRASPSRPTASSETDRLHLGRRQRPQAVLLRRRPRERAGAPALRHAERRASSASSKPSSRAAPRTARRSPSAARTPAARSRRWPSPRSASAASRCGRPRSARSRRCCARSTSRPCAGSSTRRAPAAPRAPARRIEAYLAAAGLSH